MLPDPSLIAAIRTAVEASPHHVQLRLHLASLLLAAGEVSEALDHATKCLDMEPGNGEALELAARAAASPEPLTSDGPRERVRLGGPGEDDSKANWEAERVAVRMDDVAGMDAVKKRLNMAFLAPLQNPELRRMYGKSLRGGLLLYGPPGCGKTFIARAAAGELGAQFFQVGLNDVLDMYLGESERKLHELFESARRDAPCVLFFDEIDALGRKRSLRRNSAGRDLVNQLLAEMDSLASDNHSLFLLAATNHPWDVDGALRRPGRFDRTLLVLPPDEAARVKILEFHMRGRTVESLDYSALARKTDGFSGADLAHLCEAASEYAMTVAIETGRVRPIGMDDFRTPLKEVKSSTRSWFETARNYAMFANEGGVYDELLAYLRAARLM